MKKYFYLSIIIGIIFSATLVHADIKVDSHPSQITIGDTIEITGNFGSTPGPGNNINDPNSWPGKIINLSRGENNPAGLPLMSWTENKIILSTSNFNYFRIGINTFRVYYGDFQSAFDINISAPPCTATSWSCDSWNACSVSGTQTRSCNKLSLNTFSTLDNPQNPDYCEGGMSAPLTSQSCTYIPPVCTSWTYSAWSDCQANGTKTKNIITSSPDGCSGGNPILTQSCTYIPPCIQDDYYCSVWSACSQNGNQTRVCNKTTNCNGGIISPPTTQSCTYTPSCTADTWTCGSWGECSLSGIQNRSCNKTFDCPNVQTAPPTTDQYCEAPNRPAPQTLPSGADEILNQDTIIKSTVKLLCPVNAQMASQGSGTVIDSSGIILTNKHVIAGTLGCLVGFINDFNDEPYFGERQIADILKVSPNQDIAILKIRNPQNKKLTSVDTTKSSSNLRLGTKITIYGYPAKFGTKVTYTSGDFSGTDGSYIKTTAILEYGNSGGGSYLKDGTFIGIPSAVVKGELNALGYILSINTINSWLGNSSMAYGNTSNNNYSRVSVLEDIDLNKLGSLKLFIPETDASGNLAAPVVPATPATNQKTQKVIEQSQPSQPQKESTIIESTTTTNQKINSAQNNPAPSEKEQKPKDSWIKRLFHWLVNLF